jgi:hypothetical protein
MSNNFDGQIVLDQITGIFAFGRAAGATRALQFDGYANSGPQVGQTVVGATSGATGVIVDVVARVTGTSGTIYLDAASAAFQDNENVQVAGVTKCVANGADYAYTEGAGTAAAIDCGEATPTHNAPPGSLYLKTSTGKLYVCAGMVAGTMTWNIVTSA